MKNFYEGAKNKIKAFLTWSWTKRLLHWIVISAGTMSECVFLIASLWMSVNANVHKFVLIFLDEKTTTHLTELATTAYVALPECIVGLAVVVTLSHIRVVMYNRDYRAVIWSVLYGLPTLVFLVLSLITLGCAVASTTFEMPTPLVILRALAGYMFAFTSLLYTQLGEPQEKDRLKQRDDAIAQLQQDMDKLKQENERKLTQLQQENAGNLAQSKGEKDAIIVQINAELAQLKQENALHLAALKQENERNLAQLGREKDAIITQITAELEQQKELLAESKNTQTRLLNAMNKSNEDALQAYSQDCIQWLKSGIKTVLVEDITHYTGHSKRKIEGAINKGLLQTSPRNKELILVSSLVEWLKQNVPMVGKIEPETSPHLHVVNG